MEAKELLKNACFEIGIDIDEKQTEMFFKYKEMLLEWNEKMNLTAITEEREIILKHFVDSISFLGKTGFDIKNKSVIDVGTGAGFPGIPVKIICPDIKLTLMDSLMKRVKFLEALIGELVFDDVSCVHMRAEEGGKNKDYREKFDVCVSRAVANLTVLSEYCLPFVKQGGMFISMKGPSVETELSEAEKAIKLFGGEVFDIKTVNIPFSDINHLMIFIKKLRQTPSKYPRNFGQINKNPIK